MYAVAQFLDICGTLTLEGIERALQARYSFTPGSPDETRAFLGDRPGKMWSRRAYGVPWALIWDERAKQCDLGIGGVEATRVAPFSQAILERMQQAGQLRLTEIPAVPGGPSFAKSWRASLVGRSEQDRFFIVGSQDNPANVVRTLLRMHPAP